LNTWLPLTARAAKVVFGPITDVSSAAVARSRTSKAPAARGPQDKPASSAEAHGTSRLLPGRRRTQWTVEVTGSLPPLYAPPLDSQAVDRLKARQHDPHLAVHNDVQAIARIITMKITWPLAYTRLRADAAKSWRSSRERAAKPGTPPRSSLASLAACGFPAWKGSVVMERQPPPTCHWRTASTRACQ